ncbi:MAG: glycosyltransferase family 4 protein [Candidatus Acidiferrales bacterium]
MTSSSRKPRLAIVSPFLDKSHGTERLIIEWLSQLPNAFEFHVYSNRVEDWDPSTFVFHRVPRLPGPHLFSFLWWFVANHLWRGWDRRFRGLRYDLVFSPGINCLDADVISVHIVFAEFLRQTRAQLNLARNPFRFWPRLLHRRIYYRLIVALERHLYAKPQTMLVLIAKKTARDLERFYNRSDQLPILYVGLDHSIYNPIRRAELRAVARQEIGIEEGRFTLLVVGNDLYKKGISVLFDALGLLSDLPMTLLVAGNEASAPFQSLAREKKVLDRVRFLPLRADVEFYYAAADIYTGPSLEDTFALPPEEAMACGLPTIVSSTNGTSEIITDGVDGLVLADPTDSGTLAFMIRRLHNDQDFRRSMGHAATATASHYTFERNGRDLGKIFDRALGRKAGAPARTITEEL